MRDMLEGTSAHANRTMIQHHTTTIVDNKNKILSL